MFTKAYSYNDILLIPRYSEILSRGNVDLSSKLTPKITLKIPIISSNMDTVTESEMAIEMAKNGGLGIIHRYNTIAEQAKMVKTVKRAINYVIEDPMTCTIDTRVSMAEKLMTENKIGCLLVVSTESLIEGIVTRRDLLKRSLFKNDVNVELIMTPKSQLITVSSGQDAKLLLKICLENGIENLPILDTNNTLKGLVTLKDLQTKDGYLTDQKGRLIVGAAVGVTGDYLERTAELVKNGCDLVCVDVAHGHHSLAGEAVRAIKERFDIEVMAGNVVTAEGVQYLANCGADCIKIGIGPAGVCTTRRQTGNGYPQFSAVLDCAQMARNLGVTVISDGGHCGSIGNLVKALSAGANACMLGNMLSGTTESPGRVFYRENQKYKIIRGMAGTMANLNREKEIVTAEGIEAYIPFKGDVKSILDQIAGGVRSGLSYQGCSNVLELHELLRTEKIKFCILTSGGREESGKHGVKEI